MDSDTLTAFVYSTIQMLGVVLRGAPLPTLRRRPRVCRRTARGRCGLLFLYHNEAAEVKMVLRKCLRDPIPEIEVAAQRLNVAVSAHLRSEYGIAEDLFRQSDDKNLKYWLNSVWAEETTYNKCRHSAPSEAGAVQPGWVRRLWSNRRQKADLS